ncbi:hypothetical protein ERJ75_000893500 [Trypanosoma vivax]|nr:hypothetical protein ERJ75_000893500 [Trypanosoma vivax]
MKLLADGFAHGEKASSILEAAEKTGPLAQIATQHHALSQGIAVGQDSQKHSLTALLEEALADPCNHTQDAEEADTNADTKAATNEATEQRPRTQKRQRNMQHREQQHKHPAQLGAHGHAHWHWAPLWQHQTPHTSMQHNSATTIKETKTPGRGKATGATPNRN